LSFRFSFSVSRPFFCCSLLPLSFLPLSPISYSPCLRMNVPFGSDKWARRFRLSFEASRSTANANGDRKQPPVCQKGA
jgi:hypothetical protein